MKQRKEHLPLGESDQDFFHQLYLDYKGFLFYTARQYTTDPAACEDLVQDALIRLMHNLPALREIGRCKIAKYIVLTIRTAYLDSQRRRQRENILFLDDQELELLMLEQLLPQDPEQAVSTNQAIARLKAALPARDWILLEGKYILGLSQEELGRQTGVSPDSVRMLLCRAREKARGILREDAAKGGKGNG